MEQPRSESSARPIFEIIQRLEALRKNRPSITLAAERSAKGGQTVTAILKAAQNAFTREGYAGLTIRIVAEEAGISVGNVSYYFPTKRELLEAMLREKLFDYVDENLRQIRGDDQSPLDILLNLMSFYVTDARASHRFSYRMWGYAGSDEKAKSIIAEIYRPAARILYDLVKAANPRLDHLQIRKVVLQIVSVVEGARLCIGLGPDDDIILKNAEKHVCELIRRIVEAG